MTSESTTTSNTDSLNTLWARQNPLSPAVRSGRRRALKVVRLLCLGASLGTGCALLQKKDEAGDSVRLKHRAYAQVRSSTSALAPNQKFYLAVEVDIYDEYWVPWTAIGFWNFAPTMQVEGPKGFRIGERLLPGPSQLLVDGSPQLGFRNSAAWFAEITAPDDIDPNRRYQFEVFSTWRVCSDDDCITHEKRQLVWLGSDEAPTDPAFAGSLQQHFERLPLPIADAVGGREHWEATETGTRLILTAPQGRWGQLIAAEGSDAPVRIQRRGKALQLEYASLSADARAIALLHLRNSVRFVRISPSPEFSRQ